MNFEKLRITAGVATVRIKSLLRTLLGLCGFAVLGFGAWSAYGKVAKAKAIAQVSETVTAQEAFGSVAGVDVGIMALGIVIVWLSIR